LMLDRQIRDASARIEPPRTVESLRRADIEAAPAGAATLPLRRVPLEFRRGEDRAEEEPVAEIPAEQIRVFPLPAEAGRLREGLLHHRSRVDEDLDLRPGSFHEPPPEPLQPLLDQVVVILPARIDR